MGIPPYTTLAGQEKIEVKENIIRKIRKTKETEISLILSFHETSSPDALKEHAGVNGPISRYGHAVIPMDEALAEAVVDFCGRPFLVYSADYPQPYSGDFDMSLLREFFTALTSRGGFTLHALIRDGGNSHHMAEALFKALGKALRIACTPLEGNRTEIQSTKGLL